MIIETNDVIASFNAARNFAVDKFPLSGPDGMKTQWYGLFRSDNGQAVGNGSVTSRYVPHNAGHIENCIRAVSEAIGGVCKMEYNFNDGDYLCLTPSDDKRRSIFGTADNIFPRMFVRAGYDSKPYTGGLGYYRDACRNLHIMKTVSESMTTIRHTGGLEVKMEELVETFRELSQGWEAIAARAQRMEAERVNMREFLDALYGVPEKTEGKGFTQHTNRTEAIINRLLREQRETGRRGMANDFMVSKWEAFNAIQGYVQHDASRRGANRDTTGFARAVISLNDKTVERAEELLATAV